VFSSLTHQSKTKTKQGMNTKRLSLYNVYWITRTPKGEIDYNFIFFLACMILFTILSDIVLLPGNLSVALIIFVSAFHLSCKFLAWLKSISCSLAILSKRLMPGSLRFSLLTNLVPGPMYWLVLRPVKFDSRLAQPFLNVDTTPALLDKSSGLYACTTSGLASTSHNRVLDFFSVSFLWPGLPNHF